MTEPSASPEIAASQTDFFLAILRARWPEMGPQVRILDLGCGRGELVRELLRRGYQAWGSDLELAPETLAESAFLATDPVTFQVASPDASFDVVISNQVLEHVTDLPKIFLEIRRLLRPGGVSLHAFPGRWCPLEPHVLVPLGCVIQNRPWLGLWALLGIRNAFQKGKSAREVTRLNFEYLRDHTNYPSMQRLRAMVRGTFPNYTVLGEQSLSAILRVPGHARLKQACLRILVFLHLESLYRIFRGRVLWLE